ncbi:MAG: hemerythrin domain-containing protein [Planctomycetota bacterium]|nr:hemerythrin domain-containing protein [Planctomycetota bacterium]
MSFAYRDMIAKGRADGGRAEKFQREAAGEERREPEAAAAGGDVRGLPGATLAELTDFVESRHHWATRRLLAEVEALVAEAMDNSGPLQCGNVAELRRKLEAFAAEIERHLFEEETALFPYFRELDAFAKGKGPRPHLFCGSVRYPISERWKEHEDTGENLAGLRKLVGVYRPSPADPEAICRFIMKFRELEEELEEHVRLENEDLFPMALELEKRLGIG